MTVIQAILLGIVQGLTEFLPVSSSGHLAIGQRILARFGTALPQGNAPSMIAFDLVVHVGTLLPILVVFRRDIRDFVLGVVRLNRYAWRFGLLGAVATLVTGALAFPVKDRITALFAQPLVIAGCWVVTGIILVLCERVPVRRKGLRQFTFLMAGIIGIAQALATLPGISRSGTTIAVALLLGLRRRRAAHFSFLLAFPAILAGAAGEFKDLLEEEVTLEILPLAVGFVTSAVVGWVALRWLLSFLRRARLSLFAYYVWILAAVVLLGTLTGMF